ncbi:hypothetical protein [Natribacillus halophilus]|uniref:Uncharacterized protein n=1 Tax=Natribacillus halophilus TaxID=549003 RepID=A0A1G8RUZ4_9BACI|nr:hypothetical protein [Natribacillus halophilus]SDJ20904.1 hypothetical protein SAMN04488123_12069 [Natribacillus halophilus]
MNKSLIYVGFIFIFVLSACDERELLSDDTNADEDSDEEDENKDEYLISDDPVEISEEILGDDFKDGGLEDELVSVDINYGDPFFSAQGGFENDIEDILEQYHYLNETPSSEFNLLDDEDETVFSYEFSAGSVEDLNIDDGVDDIQSFATTYFEREEEEGENEEGELISDDPLEIAQEILDDDYIDGSEDDGIVSTDIDYGDPFFGGSAQRGFESDIEDILEQYHHLDDTPSSEFYLLDDEGEAVYSYEFSNESVEEMDIGEGIENIQTFASTYHEQEEEEEDSLYENIDTSIEERDHTVGKADGDINDLSFINTQPVRNDNTDSWVKVEHDNGELLHEYILSYADEHWEEDDGVHWFIDIAHETTTSANDMGEYYDVVVYEYEDDINKDASEIGSGMVLGEYQVYKDNADIVDIYE